MIGEQQPGHLVRGVHVRRAPRQRHLDGRRAPRYEVRQLPLTDALERFVDLRRVHFSLKWVVPRDIGPVLFLDKRVRVKSAVSDNYYTKVQTEYQKISDALYLSIGS